MPDQQEPGEDHAAEEIEDALGLLDDAHHAAADLHDRAFGLALLLLRDAVVTRIQVHDGLDVLVGADQLGLHAARGELGAQLDEQRHDAAVRGLDPASRREVYRPCW